MKLHENASSPQPRGKGDLKGGGRGTKYFLVRREGGAFRRGNEVKKKEKNPAVQGPDKRTGENSREEAEPSVTTS